jgi:hypothetical protein
MGLEGLSNSAAIRQTNVINYSLVLVGLKKTSNRYTVE